MTQPNIAPKKTPNKKQKSNGASEPTRAPAHSESEPPRDPELSRRRKIAISSAQYNYDRQQKLEEAARAAAESDRIGLRRSGATPYEGGDGSAEVNQHATIADILPQLWEVSDCPDQTILENALNDTHDSLEILVAALRNDEGGILEAPTLVARFVERVAHRANLAKHLARRIENANAVAECEKGSDDDDADDDPQAMNSENVG